MLDQSLFVSTAVHQKTITLPDGKQLEMYFKELPAIEITKYSNAASSTNEETRDWAMIRLIAYGMCDADGKSIATAEQVAQFKPTVISLISEALLEINGKGGEKKD